MINTLVVLNLLIKPSFLFVYIPITFFYVIKFCDTKKLYLSISPIILGSSLILLQYILIYYLEIGSFTNDKNRVIISSAFKAHSAWVPMWYIPLSIISSFALPIASIIMFRDIFRYKPFTYALLMTILGILISAFIMEDGGRELDGNFLWQNTICSFLLFFSTISF